MISDYLGLLALFLLVVLLTHQVYLKFWGWTYLQPEHRNFLFWLLVGEWALFRPSGWLTEEGIKWIARHRSYDLIIAIPMGLAAVVRLSLN